MASVIAFTGMAVRAAPATATNARRPTIAAKKPSKSKELRLRRRRKHHAAAAAKPDTPATSAMLTPAGGDTLEQHFPPATRNLAKHIVFLSGSVIALDNSEVVVSAPPASDAGYPAAYSAHFPNDDDTLNWALLVGIMPS
jgi:hypothetical protein